MSPAEPTETDLRFWRDLAAMARAAALHPVAPSPAFAKAAREAKRVCVPGALTRGNPCIQLSRLSKRFVEETAGGRRALADVLLSACAAAEIQLDGATGAGRRERKDIDG